MVRKLISLLSVFVLLTAILSGCSKKTKEYTDVIPENVQTLFSLDLKSLFNKTGVTTAEINDMKQDFIAAISSGMSVQSMEQIQKILTNPKESGIDFEVPIYLFFNDAMSSTILVNKVSSKTKLRATLDVMKDEKLFNQYEKGDGYEYALIHNNVIIAFDEYALIIVALNSASQLNDAKAHINRMMNQTKDNSITANRGFLKMKEEKGDIHFISSAASLTSLYGQHLKNDLGYANMDFKDLYIYGAIRFEQGAINSSFTYFTENAKNQELLKEQAETVKKTKGTFTNFFPKTTLAYLEMGIDGDELFEMFQSNKGYYNEFTSEQDQFIKSILDALEGDLALGITDVSLTNIPKFDLYASIENDDFLEEIYNNQAKVLPTTYKIAKIDDKIYSFTSSDISFYYGSKNGSFFATNNSDIKSLMTTVTPSITSTSFGPDLKDKKVMFVINVSQVLDLPLVKAVSQVSAKDFKLYIDMVSKIDYIDALNTHDNSYEMNIVLKNNTTNSLAQIVEYAKLFLAFF